MSDQLPIGVQAISQVQAMPDYSNPKAKLVKVEVKAESKFQTLADIEKEHIEKALKLFENNKSRAAQALGVTTKTLYNKLHEYGLFEKYQSAK